jgi:hypothetical protein
MDLDIKKYISLGELIPIVKETIEKNKDSVVPMFTITLTPIKNQLKISLAASLKVIK